VLGKGGGVRLALCVLVCLVLAGCAQGGTNADDSRKGGFYGGVEGGLSPP
jgi:hypothetical protein